MRAVFTGVFLFFSVLLTMGQQINIPLDGQFNPVENQSENHRYTKILQQSELGQLVTILVDREGEEISTENLFTDSEFFQWKDHVSYDDQGKIWFVETVKKRGSYHVIKVFSPERKVLDIICNPSNTACNGFFTPSEEQLEQVNRNVLMPSFENLEEWNQTLVKNLTYPSAARRKGAKGKVWIGIKITEVGTVEEVTFQGEKEIHEALLLEAKRVFELFQGNYIPARDIYGNHVSAWMQVPIDFLGMANL
ncbi:MAG: energy transducer TonB [Mongoliitalea sp.]